LTHSFSSEIQVIQLVRNRSRSAFHTIIARENHQCTSNEQYFKYYFYEEIGGRGAQRQPGGLPTAKVNLKCN